MDRVIDEMSKKNMKELSKMEILFKFPNLYHGTKTSIVLKRPKTEGSIRVTEVPRSVISTLFVLKDIQNRLKDGLGSNGYMEYDLVICQANGHPLMKEHFNKRFKEILIKMKPKKSRYC